MKQYHDMLKHILENGNEKIDRTGVGTLSVFGYQMRFNLNDGFPLLTTKKVFTKAIIHELLWFLKGDTNIKYLNDNDVTIWDEWADDCGNLGPIYGYQWRNWVNYNPVTYQFNFVDQISDVIQQIKTNPESRRHIVSAWHAGQIENMALPPCHTMFQFYVYNNKLSCQLYQRSVDCALGLPFNIASYALLTHMIAQVCNLEVGEFIHTSGDAHIYLNHIKGVNEQLQRDYSKYNLPILKLNESVKNIDDFTYDDITIENYQSYPSIKFDIAV